MYTCTVTIQASRAGGETQVRVLIVSLGSSGRLDERAFVNRTIDQNTDEEGLLVVQLPWSSIPGVGKYRVRLLDITTGEVLHDRVCTVPDEEALDYEDLPSTVSVAPDATGNLLVRDADGTPSGVISTLVVPSGSLTVTGGTGTLDFETSDVLSYLQSLPTSVPSSVNMPYWDEEVLLRSVPGTGGDSFWDDTDTWDDTEIWVDGGSVGAGSGRIYSIGVNEPGESEQLVRRIVFPAGSLEVSGTIATIANLGGGNLTGHVTSVGNATVLGSFTKAQLDAAVSDGNVLYVGDAPTAHAHGNLTNAGAIGSTANLPVITGTSGVLQVGSFGTTANTFCQGNDARLSDARTPTAHNQDASTITTGTLPVARLSFTKAELDTAVSDGNVLYVGDITSNATHTGDVTGATALTIADAAVTLAKMANLAQDQFIGRTTASTGVPQTATITAAARTVLDDATVAAMVDTLGGASSTGTGGLMRAASPTTTGSMSAAEIVFSADARFTEQTYTPTGTTQTIDLNAGNLNTLSLGSTTGNLTLTLTVPTSAASGRIKIIQHGTTARNITIVLSSLTAKWFSVTPTWTSQAVGRHTILSYTRDGSFMNFSAVEEV